MSAHTPMTGNINVFCVGDSTTVGITGDAVQPPTNQMWAYRKALSDALLADIGSAIPNTVSFTWVGPNSTGTPPSDHYSAVGGDTAFLAFQRLLSACAFVTGTQVVVIMPLGLNDTIGDLTQFPINYLSAVRRVHNLLRPLRPRFVFSLIQVAGDPTHQAINDALALLWPELTREGIEYESMSWNWLPTTGNFHPLQTLYDQLGANDVSGECYHLAVRKLIGYPITP